MFKRAQTYMFAVLLVACGKSGSPMDMTVGNPDLSMVRQDLATNGNQDLAGTVDQAGTTVDLTGVVVDLAGTTVDLAGTTVDLAMSVDLAGVKVDMNGTIDMAKKADMATPDMAKKTDMATPDMAKKTDMAKITDMATAVDLATPDMATAGGAIGAPCTTTADCTGGTMGRVCWAKNLLNNTLNLPTPNGYCSATCNVDMDCGAGAVCANLGAAGSFCLAQCMDAITCRHPGYDCAFFTDTYGVCFPGGIFDCDPTVTNCVESGTMKPGGCLRGAYENAGNCSASCNAGAGSCAVLNGQKRECNYYIAPMGDAWKGLICLPQTPTPIPGGGACVFVNDCIDGDQCDPTSKKCAQMCTKGGGMPACSAGVCTDIWMTPNTGPGLCH